MCGKIKKIAVFAKKFAKTFGGTRKNMYLCTRNQKTKITSTKDCDYGMAP